MKKGRKRFILFRLSLSTIVEFVERGACSTGVVNATACLYVLAVVWNVLSPVFLLCSFPQHWNRTPIATWSSSTREPSSGKAAPHSTSRQSSGRWESCSVVLALLPLLLLFLLRVLVGTVTCFLFLGWFVCVCVCVCGCGCMHVGVCVCGGEVVMKDVCADVIYKHIGSLCMLLLQFWCLIHRLETTTTT